MARTIARRGVRLIATAHGETLADVVHNPELCWLVGGAVQAASGAGGESAPFRRAEPPTMETALELRWDRTLAVYRRVDRAVDSFHAGMPCRSDEARVVTVAVEQQLNPDPEPVRTHELIPERDPWGRVPEDAGAIRPAIALLYLLAKDVGGALHIRTASRGIGLHRCAGLPLAELRAAAEDDLFALDLWVEFPNQIRAALALWSFTAARETTLEKLPEDLRPQAIIRAGFGDALVWIPAAPYPDEPPEGLPKLGVFLAEIALALDAIPAGPEDGIPLPRQDADVNIHSATHRTDPGALWNWAHAAAERNRGSGSRLPTPTARGTVPAPGPGDGVSEPGASRAPNG